MTCAYQGFNGYDATSRASTMLMAPPRIGAMKVPWDRIDDAKRRKFCMLEDG
jgi:hypothetical protein